MYHRGMRKVVTGFVLGISLGLSISSLAEDKKPSIEGPSGALMGVAVKVENRYVCEDPEWLKELKIVECQ